MPIRGVETYMYSQCVTDRQTDRQTGSVHQASEDEDGIGGDDEKPSLDTTQHNTSHHILH